MLTLDKTRGPAIQRKKVAGCNSKVTLWHKASLVMVHSQASRLAASKAEFVQNRETCGVSWPISGPDSAFVISYSGKLDLKSHGFDRLDREKEPGKI